MTALADVALVAGLVTAVAPFAQARRILRRRSSDDVSLTWLWFYGGGCLVWIAYGISIESVPLVVSQAVAAAGSAVAILLTVRWRRPAGEEPPGSNGRRRDRSHSSRLRVEDVMLPSPSVISEELVVEEARRSFAAGLSGALPVVDHAGRAVGVLNAADIGALPPLARASCLVGQLADRDPAILARAAAGAAEVLGREAVMRTGFAMVTDGRRRLVGVAWCRPPARPREARDVTTPPGKEQSWSSAAFASTSPKTPT
jgi:MtN3 and saliva related transmembrane protein